MKLEDKIAKLSADMEKQRIAAEKENEKIRSEEEAYLNDYLRQSLGGEITLNSGQEKQEALLNFFAENETSKENALNELRGNELFYQQQLGIAYYNNTINKISKWEG